ncbi:MAG: DUF2309 domain-containing protein [Pseudomonadota bacterium]
MNIATLNKTDERGAKRIPSLSASAVKTAAAQAIEKIAPLWPLKTFVAVNPMLGFAGEDFSDAAQAIALAHGGRTLATRSFYKDAFASGRIDADAIAEALKTLGGSYARTHTVDTIIAALDETPKKRVKPAPTVADIASETSDTDWNAVITDKVSAWAGSYFDEGQAAWRSPWRDLPPYQAWREEAMRDASFKHIGLSDLRAAIAALPETAVEMLQAAATRHAFDEKSLSAYFLRLLATVSGWAGHARFKGWIAGLNGAQDETAIDMLAIRAAYDLAILDATPSATLSPAWATATKRFSDEAGLTPTKDFTIDYILHTAYEISGRRPLLDALTAENKGQTQETRASSQLVFCIDVRSERLRRSIEAAEPSVETMGFAGFFGFAIEVAPLGSKEGGAQCPVLLAPSHTVAEHVCGASHEENETAIKTLTAGKRFQRAWKAFKSSSVSSFAFVEAMGFGFAGKLARASIGATENHTAPRTAPSIEPATLGERAIGFDAETRLALATGALKSMSLTDNFARLVVMVGHGSTTENNPYAAGLDCGACGGHTGEANARVAAAILNDPAVRDGLKDAGISIPEDTHFLAGLHDTTTDDVTLFETDRAPESHADDITALQKTLATAGETTRTERAPFLAIPSGDNIHSNIDARARDWSQVRPEWGLAGCSAFIVGPRARSMGHDFGGRAFLHSYDWKADDSFATLELIMTAPMVVASWINLQYYASTVDNRVFGSGDKTLHNVVGALGVLEGNAGDLRVGLPLQSVHDGAQFMHEPMRLNAFIDAPIEAMNEVIAKHAGVKDLLDNGWVHLYALTETGAPRRYLGGLEWETAAAAA